MSKDLYLVILLASFSEHYPILLIEKNNQNKNCSTLAKKHKIKASVLHLLQSKFSAPWVYLQLEH